MYPSPISSPSALLRPNLVLPPQLQQPSVTSGITNATHVTSASQQVMDAAPQQDKPQSHLLPNPIGASSTVKGLNSTKLGTSDAQMLPPRVASLKQDSDLKTKPLHSGIKKAHSDERGRKTTADMHLLTPPSTSPTPELMMMLMIKDDSQTTMNPSISSSSGCRPTFSSTGVSYTSTYVSTKREEAQVGMQVDKEDKDSFEAVSALESFSAPVSIHPNYNRPLAVRVCRSLSSPPAPSSSCFSTLSSTSGCQTDAKKRKASPPQRSLPLRSVSQSDRQAQKVVSLDVYQVFLENPKVLLRKKRSLSATRRYTPYDQASLDEPRGYRTRSTRLAYANVEIDSDSESENVPPMASQSSTMSTTSSANGSYANRNVHNLAKPATLTRSASSPAYALPSISSTGGRNRRANSTSEGIPAAFPLPSSQSSNSSTKSRKPKEPKDTNAAAKPPRPLPAFMTSDDYEFDNSLYQETSGAPSVSWKIGSHPLKLSKEDPDYDILTPEELETCATLRIYPSQYLNIKKTMLKAVQALGPFKKREAQTWFRIDVNKVCIIYDWFKALGWIPNTEEWQTIGHESRRRREMEMTTS